MTSNAVKPDRGQAVSLAVQPVDRGAKRETAHYRHLFDIKAGFDQIVRSLAALRKEHAFVAKKIDRFSGLAKEARASTDSYLIGVMEGEETGEAGRRFGKRRNRELREE